MTRAPLALVFAAGDAPSAHLLPDLLAGAELLLAADAGLALVARLGLTPDRIVGDLDSVDPELLARYSGVRVERHPVDKDELDLELALAAARDLGGGSFRVLGAFGGRLDHTLAALLVGAGWAAAGHLISLHGGSHEAHFCTPELPLRLALETGTTVSLLALRGPAVVSSEGLRFPLSETRLGWGSGLGMSNVVVSPTIGLRSSSGTAVLIVEHQTD